MTATASPARPSQLKEFWRYFSENHGAVAGLILLAALVLVAVFAPLVAPFDPDAQFRDALLARPMTSGPDGLFLLGTDALGRDILSRLIFGARFSLFIGVVVVAVSLIGGIVIGLFAGYFRGMVDTVIMRVMDVILAFPSLLLALTLVAVLGPGLVNAMIAIAIVAQPHYVRLTRAAVMSERSRDYVTSARVAGAGPLWLMFVTILPNCMAPLIVRPRCRSPAPFSTPPPSASLAWAPSRQRRNGAPCCRKRASSSPAPGGSSPSPVSPS